MLQPLLLVSTNNQHLTIFSVTVHDLMRRRRRSPTCLQRSFVALVMATVTMFVLMELLHNNHMSIQPPYALQKTYVTAQCDDKRLGNAMFIYAAVVGIAKRVNASTMIQTSCRVSEIFQLSALVVDNAESMIPMHTVYEEYGRRASAFDIKTDKLKSENTILKGYFQSWRYFRDALEEVKAEFKFHDATEDMVRSFLQENKPSDWRNSDFIRVGIHVRRGDLLLDHYKNYGYTAADRDYFQHAMTYFHERYDNVQFVVCSDDMEWAINNIKGDHVIYSANHKDHEDMAILSHCDHTIMSVGSFGWWAAWLANGTTIYYAKWPKEFSQLEYHVQKTTYFPPYWISME